MKIMKAWMSLAMAATMGLFAYAGSTKFGDVTVDYDSASTNWVDGELVLTYKSSSSLAISDGAVNADILVVGGGGGGGRSNSTSSYYGSGDGGSVLAIANQMLLSDSYEIAVGSGGSGGTSNGKSGFAGGESSLKGGSVSKTAAGGGGGGTSAAAGSPTTGTESLITGTSVYYGKGGVKASGSTTAGKAGTNPGDGGTGNKRGASGGSGAKGIVVVRLTAVYANTDVTLKDLTLGVDEEIVDFAEQTTGAAVDIIYSEVASTSFNPEDVARDERTKEGRFALVGSYPGETTAKIAVRNEQEKTLTTYIAKVTVTPSVFLKDLSIQRGETTASLVPQDADTPIDLDYDSVKALKSSVPEIADFVKLPNGKIGVVGKVTGTVDMTIVTEGQSYQFKVTVEKLLSGLYKAGAYDVAVSNASEISYVDGDLVLIYRNVDAAVKKSFELPKATTGRLLAVGGGGAGGQDQAGKYSASYGLPGGGGAGGLVIKDSQSFEATTYAVEVGAGGGAFGRTLNTSSSTKTWEPVAYGSGSNGADTAVKKGSSAIVTAKGGGGGGRRETGKAGGSGGGGSANYSSKTVQSKAGGSGTSGQGDAGGSGSHALYGAGGGGAGGKGGNTTAAESSSDPTNKNVDGSGAGGPGEMCDITGENLEYARGGAGGVPRVYLYYYSKGGVTYYTKKQPSDTDKETFDGGKFFWVEASDGKPGRDGFGDGGGGSGHYNSNPTFAGRGGNGAVIVRIPPYKISVEDALKTAFADQPVTVSGSTVSLNGDVTGVIEIPDNLGTVTINLNGHAIKGADGAADDDITPGGNGESALKIVPHTYDCDAGVTKVTVSGTGTLSGGKGGDGHPQGRGAPALAGDASNYDIAASVTLTDGTDGKFLEQHPHEWEWECDDNKIYAICVANDGETCTYKVRKPMIAFEAADAEFTGKPYEGLTLVNTVTEATGLPVQPPVYEGIEGTHYSESNTAPSEQGKYRVKLGFRNMTIIDTFTIIESKPEQDSVYKSWKTATRDGDSVDIRLTATFSGNRAINDGNVLFLGSRCNAHSMATGTVEKTINAMTKYADVRWYAYGSSDPEKNQVDQLTKKGDKVYYKEESSTGKILDETVHLIGGNHFVHKEMMNDLYAELVEKKNLKGDYDLILLEFDGDLLCREGFAPYQLHYKLPDGWDETKAAQLRAVMEKYYQAGRVVWLVPDVNQEKSDAGYTGEYPWTSNPEFIWQRTFLGATETKGYRNPYQKNYEDADELVKYIEDVLIGAFFQLTTITDTVKDGLEIKAVTPQIRNNDGFWMDMEKVSPNGAGGSFKLIEPFFGVEVTATVTVTGQKVVTVFDTSNVQQEAIRRGMVWGNDLRMDILTTMNGFFDNVASGDWKDTNEGDAVFEFKGSESGETFTITTTNEPPQLQNILYEPSYKAEDWVSIYDGEGHTITVTVTDPDPTTHPFEIKYSLTENGTYVEDLLVTNRSDKVPVWFEITDSAGKYLTVTNKAYVTILPRVVVEQAEDAEKVKDGTPLTQPAHSNVMSRAIAEAEKLYPGQGEEAAGFVNGEGFKDVPMTADSQQTEVGEHANTIDKDNVKLQDNTDPKNYIFIYLPGNLRVTDASPMGIKADPTVKYYDGVPTNITWAVTNATGEVITPDKVYLRQKGSDTWVEADKFVPYTNVTDKAGIEVEVKAEKAAYADAVASSTVTILPRVVVEQAGDGEWVFDGKEHDQPAHAPDVEAAKTLAKEIYFDRKYEDIYSGPKRDDWADAIGFVGTDGFATMSMTGDSKITNPGTQPNVIDQGTVTFKSGTDLDNYIIRYEPGTLEVTGATMGMEAFPAEKFYDGVPTNITWVVTNATGAAITPDKVYLREKGSEKWIPAEEFAPYLNATNWNGAGVEVEAKAEKDGFADAFAESTVLVKPRIVVSHAKDGSWVFDNQDHRQPEYYEDEAVEAEKSKAKWGTDEVLPGSVGFVEGEGYAADLVMTDGSKIKFPDETPVANVIDQSAEKTALKPNTNPENYELHYLDGELKVTTGTFDASATPVVKVYDAVPTNIEVTVTGVPAGVEPVLTYSYSEDGGFVPASEFTGPTNVNESATVYCKVTVPGCGEKVVSAEVTILKRYVVEQAGSAEKVFDNTPLTQPAHEEKPAEELKDALAAYEELYGAEMAASAAGFVGDDAFASVPMTGDSTITDPGVVSNTIDSASVTFTPSYDPENYSVRYLQGELKVTDGTFDASATPVVKVYDTVPTNIEVTVTGVPDGVTPVLEYSYSETEGFVPASEFTGPTNVNESATVYCKVTVPGCGEKVVSAEVTILKRYVVEQAGSAEKVFDNTPLTQPAHEEKPAEELKDALAAYEELYGAEVAASAAGFVGDDAFASVPMTGDSTITNPGVVSNTIDSASVTFTPSYDPENYSVRYLQGELKVTKSGALTVEAFPAEKFYDAVPTNVTWTVKVGGEPVDDAKVYLREKGTETWIEAKDFVPYLNATNWNGAGVEVEVRATKEGYDPATAESTVLVKPRIVVEHAKDAFKEYGPGETPQELRQPEHYEDVAAEEEKAVKVYGTNPPDADSMGFVPGEGFDQVPMTDESYVLIPGTKPNVIDGAKTTLKEGTNPANYLIFLLDGTLEIRVRDEEVHGDVDVPKESQKVIDEKLDDLVKNDPKAGDEPYVKIQMTVTKAENLTEKTRTTKTVAESNEKKQIEAITKEEGKPDKSEFVDIIIERTYDPIVDAPGHEYTVDDWDSLDDSKDRVKIPGISDIIPVTIPVNVPDDMELIGVTRSCKGKNEVLSPLTPEEVAAGIKEGFVYDPVAKTVTVYARDFCVFGFHMKKKSGTPFNSLCERPLVFDFKATVKHMFLKEVQVNGIGGFSGPIYVKVIRSAELRGYLVVDRAGATSQTVVTGRGTDYNNIPASGMDYGRSRAFLVVQNTRATDAVRKPKILPAVLDAKWTVQNLLTDAGIAEGYLYVGGDSVACVRPQLDIIGGVPTERSTAPQAPSAGTPGMTMSADYAWTSAYLFGIYNGPNWCTGGALSQIEQAINAAQPPDLQIRKAGVPVTPYPYYHDTWMNCVGLGKYFVPQTKKQLSCCGQDPFLPCGALPPEPTLSTLSGSLKGGLFLCSETGISAMDDRYVTFNGGIWEDQFVTPRLVPAGRFAPDSFQSDLWRDGAVAQETTDVLSGNWSIKIRQNFIPDEQITDQGENALLTDTEMDALAFGADARASGLAATTYPLHHHVEAATGLYMLVATLKAAALKLDGVTPFIRNPTVANDGEIWSLKPNVRLETPVLTPRFAQYFGLANFW